MSDRIQHLKDAWDDREQRLGATKRSVLFKRFPGWLNQSIHRRHRSFVLRHLPEKASRVLDVGCGYGRMSLEIKQRFPEMQFQGIDLCAKFCEEFQRSVGPCHSGSIQTFESDENYDFILVVTLLMYLDAEEYTPILRRLWSYLKPGGCLLCIEPAIEFLTLWRRLTGRASASPTGGTVYHFRKSELAELCANLEGSAVVGRGSVRLIPFLPFMALHHCMAVNKLDGNSAHRGEQESPPDR